jgi:hypothetical protein
MEFRCFRVPGALFVTSLATLLAACRSSTGLPAAAVSNVEDTVSLYALDGTSLSAPSGFSISGNQAVRTDHTSAFDFAFNITPTGTALLLPTGAVGLGVGSGIAKVSTPFGSLTLPPDTGYADSTGVQADSGLVAVVRSRVAQCYFGTLASYYGKIEVLQVDTIARRVDLRVLMDVNCGYRGLEPGLPSQ